MKISSLFLLASGLGLTLGGALACRPATMGQPSSSELIRFERTACMGPCPVDILTIFGDGRMRYEGRQHGPRTGLFTARLTPDERTALIGQFEAARFFDFAATYSSRATDLPTYYLTFTSAGRSHRVKDYDLAPAALKRLESRLEELITAERWQPQPAPAQP